MSSETSTVRSLLKDIETLLHSLHKTVEKCERNKPPQVLKLLQQAKDLLKSAKEEIFNFEGVSTPTQVHIWMYSKLCLQYSRMHKYE